jgi:glycosyltransferase involved in cell wall biosynthesis
MARVLYLITSSGVGGAELALWQLLRRLDRTRWEPTVISLKPPGEIAGRIRELGIEVVSPGIGDETGAFAAFELLLEARRLPGLLGGRRFDLVHSLLFRANLLARLAWPRLGRPPLINGVRVTPEEEGPWLRFADRWSCRRVTRFLALSPALAADLQTRLALPPGRVLPIANGVDLAEADRLLAAARPLARRQFGLFAPEIAIACIGRLHRQKGLVHLLGAFRALLEVYPTARLLLAGDGPDRAALEGTVAALRLGPFVKLLGAVTSPWPVLAAADIFVLPSLWEGMPNALLEAMAAGLPAVATAVGAVPEMVADGREALLVPPADAGALARALAELAGAPSRRREMGGRARQRVESAYRIETTVAHTERLYDELLGAHRRAG